MGVQSGLESGGREYSDNSLLHAKAVKNAPLCTFGSCRMRSFYRKSAFLYRAAILHSIYVSRNGCGKHTGGDYRRLQGQYRQYQDSERE